MRPSFLQERLFQVIHQRPNTVPLTWCPTRTGAGVAVRVLKPLDAVTWAWRRCTRGSTSTPPALHHAASLWPQWGAAQGHSGDGGDAEGGAPPRGGRWCWTTAACACSPQGRAWCTTWSARTLDSLLQRRSPVRALVGPGPGSGFACASLFFLSGSSTCAAGASGGGQRRSSGSAPVPRGPSRGGPRRPKGCSRVVCSRATSGRASLRGATALPELPRPDLQAVSPGVVQQQAGCGGGPCPALGCLASLGPYRDGAATSREGCLPCPVWGWPCQAWSRRTPCPAPHAGDGGAVSLPWSQVSPCAEKSFTAQAPKSVPPAFLSLSSPHSPSPRCGSLVTRA